MMQALELGDKNTTDKLELLMHNFDPSFPIPIALYIPPSSDPNPPDSFSSSCHSDSSEIARTLKPSGSRRQASRVHRESLLGA